MEPELISIVFELVSNVNFKISFVSSHIMANILSEGKGFWEQYIKFDQVLKFDSIKANLKSRICEWKTNSLQQQLVFHSLKPLSRLLQCNDRIPQEVHFYAIWTINYLIFNDLNKYCRLLTEDNCIQVIENLMECNQTEEYVKKYAKSVLAQNRYSSTIRGSHQIIQNFRKDNNEEFALEQIHNVLERMQSSFSQIIF